MTIEELAVKCGAQKRWGQSAISADVIIFTAKQLQAFADEWLALNSNEPFGYWHAGKTEEESDFFIAKDSGDVSCPDCIKLYKANPINQALLESHKRLEEALTEIVQFDVRNTRKNDKCIHEKYGFEDCENCISDYAEKALAAIPESVKELK